MLKKAIEKKMKEITKDVVNTFDNRIVTVIKGSKRRYILRCPDKDCKYVGEHLERHLTRKKEEYRWSEKAARLLCSMMVRVYCHLTKIVKNDYEKPLPCRKCYRWVVLSNHKSQKP